MHGIGWGLPRRAFAFRNHMLCTGGFLGSSDGKEPARNMGDLSSTPGPGRSPGEGPGNPLSTLAWRIPWTEEPGGPQSMGSQRVGRSWAANTHTHTYPALNIPVCCFVDCLPQSFGSLIYSFLLHRLIIDFLPVSQKRENKSLFLLFSLQDMIHR